MRSKIISTLAILCLLHQIAAKDLNLLISQRLTDLRKPSDESVLSDEWRSVAAGSMMGVHAFNERDDSFTPALGQLGDCSLQIVPYMVDSGSTGAGAVESYRNARANMPAMHAIVGAARSDASKPLAILAGIDKVPQVSYWSTSDQFDSLKSNFPLFSRTIPSDSAIANAAAEFFHFHGHTNVGIAYLDDAYGSAYKSAFVKFCGGLDPPISVQAESFQATDDNKLIEAAVRNLAAAKIRVGIVVLSEEFSDFFKMAAEYDLTGEGTLWILSEGVSNNFIGNLDGDLQRISNGMGTMLSQGGVVGNEHYDSFLENWKNLDGTNIHSMISDAITSAPHFGPDDDLQPLNPSFFNDTLPFDVATYAYDAVISVGLAACMNQTHFDRQDIVPSGGEILYNNLMQTNFDSITGTVRFDPSTGSRLPETGSYVLYNHRVDDQQKTTSPLVGTWTSQAGWKSALSVNGVKKAFGESFQFSDGSFAPPSDVIIPEEDFHFLHDGLRFTGQILVCFNLFVACWFGFLVFRHNSNKVIRASQPKFLIMILVGCCISTFTIVFLGIDDKKTDGSDEVVDDLVCLDDDCLKRTSASVSSTCMYVPIFYSLGFVFSFSALFAKVTRIAKIFGNRKLNRVSITTADMIKPIAALLLLDGLLLFLWANDDDSQLVWVRTATFRDQYDNPVSSTGKCAPRDDNASNAWYYLGSILLIHIIVLVWGNIMCYRARSAGTAFAESKYVFIAMASNLQILALGLPILILVHDNPLVNFFVRTGIIFLNDFGVMLLIFIPKFYLVFSGDSQAISNATATSTATSNNQRPSGARKTSEADNVSSPSNSEARQTNLVTSGSNLLEYSEEDMDELRQRIVFLEQLLADNGSVTGSAPNTNTGVLPGSM